MISSQDLLEENLDWKPHSKSMTLGQLALPLANIPGAIAELATRSTFDVNTQIPRPGPANVDELLSTHDQSVARAKQLLGQMDKAMLSGRRRMASREQEVMTIPRAGLLRSIMLNHSYHHRGQLTVYLRQVGAFVPAVYGSSADENPLALGQRSHR